MMIEIPDEEAAALRERVVESYTLAGCRTVHDQAVADDRLDHAADWSVRIALLEWNPPREFKVGDVVRRRGDSSPAERIVKGVDGDLISFGVAHGWITGRLYVLVKAVDDDE